MSVLLYPLHRMVWARPERRARKLLEFAEVEAGGGRDLVRAAELTADPRLRRSYLAHARDEARHAAMFRSRGRAVLEDARANGRALMLPAWISPGEPGLDDLQVDRERDDSLLAFIHLSESAAARRFATYAGVLGCDPPTQALFARILSDEESHMRYSLAELDRVAPGRRRALIWKARLRRLWKSYLRLATVIASVIAGVILTLQYFVLLPPFAWMAKRAGRREAPGWVERDGAEG